VKKTQETPQKDIEKNKEYYKASITLPARGET
jgi:phage-related protein